MNDNGKTSAQRARAAARRRRRKFAAAILLIALVLVGGFSALFQVLMSAEGQSHSWATAVYWTITTMSTLGYGDVTFSTDIGRLYSMVVLLSGAIFILVLLPYFVIQHVLTPWLDKRDAARAPRRAPAQIRDHLILVGSDTVVETLVARAKRSRVPSVLVVDDPKRAGLLHDRGYHVVVGPLDSVETYRKAGVERAKMVVSMLPDTTSTNVVFTVRQVAKDVTIAVTADKAASVDVLELAGADHVLELAKQLGAAMAERVLGTTGRTHRIGAFGRTIIAEAAARHTDLVGRSLLEARTAVRCMILAVMRKGRLRPLDANQVITEDTVLILAGTAEQLRQYDAQFQVAQTHDEPVLIIGGGRVGRAAARALTDTGLAATIVEQVPGRAGSITRCVEGDAADLEVLRSAGFDAAPAVLVTTHDDDLNVYLSLYCRRLREGIQVVSRATHEQNVATLYRAGADGVLSYATTGATELWNRAKLPHRMVIAEGNELFLVPRPAALARLPVRNPEVYHQTGCQIVAVAEADGTLLQDTERIPTTEGHQLLLLGDRHAEKRFRAKYLHHR
ncbi:potassium channel family protein [Pseudactinotalea sp. Z1748]|uniref:potassium channel family protein n=1 Tax=Pseudactinotalea sp. Z1748 TaxID=3413027 RepID=UPI003C7B2A47